LVESVNAEAAPYGVRLGAHGCSHDDEPHAAVDRKMR
jgi:hypothetical protein